MNNKAIISKIREVLVKICEKNPCVRKIGCPDCAAREALILLNTLGGKK